MHFHHSVFSQEIQIVYRGPGLINLGQIDVYRTGI